ncbi:Nuclear hormone receptor FTZ-F1 beta [Clonorchis sinensis]|uniref:Nuclear hormone receptor FTZ-F1 beta n=1 Tax=Clonorchis sinensis TaxID=79923 RepID=A0A8T1MMS9_CLOSI|nr:Nuclear hormone receptor FTZ-F1 beta [Clonorchis sinensis]
MAEARAIASTGSTSTAHENVDSSVANTSILPVNVDSGALGPAETNDDRNATHVTIQLSDGMQGSSLTQQKLQDLIMQLSQSGQIQLREDSKIVIDLKFTGKVDEDTEKPKVESTPPTDSGSGASRLSITAATTVVNSHLANHSSVSALKCEPPSGPTAAATRHQLSTQQPTYILVPAGQLTNSQEAQLYSGSGQLRAVSAGGTVLRTLGGPVASSGFGNQDRSFILVQQPLSGGAATTSAANSVVVGNTGGATIVPLRQVSGVSAGGGGSVGRVAANTTWVSAGPTRFVGHSGATDLYVNNNASVGVGPRSGPGSYLTLTPSGATAGGNVRESTWQQYVKQFTKLGPCPICGDKISGYHYGIFCCESCKGFFKRTVQNAKRYACHHPSANSVCEINVSSRKKCPACRFLKCVDKGMRIEAIRSDRTRGGRSMYPGSRYLRQMAARVSTGRVTDPNSTDPSSVLVVRDGKLDPEQLSCALAGLQHPLGPDGLPSSVDAGGGVYLDPAVLGTHGEDDDDAEHSTMQLDHSMLEYPGSLNLNVSSCGTPFVGRQVIVSGNADAAGRTRIELPKIISEILAVEESIEAEPEDSLEIDSSSTPPETTVPEGVTEDEAAVYRALLNLADQRLYRTVRWSRALPDFAQLDTDDQILLLQNCWADLLCLDCCWRSLPTPTEIRLTSSKCINLEAARELGAEEIVERMLQLTQYLTQLQLDLVEYACLKVIVLMQPDLKNLKAAEHVREYQESVRRMLMDYIVNSSGKRDKFGRLMSRIPELQLTSHTARMMLVDLDLSAYLSNNSLLMELLRSDIQRFAPTKKPETSDLEGSSSMDTTDAKCSTIPTTSVSVSADSAVSCQLPGNGTSTDKNGMETFDPTSLESRDMGCLQASTAFGDGDLVTDVSEVMDGNAQSQPA